MKKIISLGILLCSISLLSSCSVFQRQGEAIECNANFRTSTFPWANDYPVKIDRRWVDRFGRVWLHPKPNLYLKFSGYWQRDTLFNEIQCKNK